MPVNLTDIILLALVAAAAGAALRHMLRGRGSPCGGSCAACARACGRERRGKL